MKPTANSTTADALDDTVPAFVEAVRTIQDINKVLGDEIRLEGIDIPTPPDIALATTTLEAIESEQGYDDAARLLRIAFAHPRYRDVAMEQAFELVQSPANRMLSSEDRQLLESVFHPEGSVRKQVHERLQQEAVEAQQQLRDAIDRLDADNTGASHHPGLIDDYARLAADAQRRVVESSNFTAPAIVQGFRLWEAGKLELREQEPQESKVAQLFYKAKLLLEKTVNLVKGRGFQDAEDLFSAIRDGGKQLWSDGYATTRTGHGSVDLAEPTAQLRTVDPDEVQAARFTPKSTQAMLA